MSISFSAVRDKNTENQDILIFKGETGVKIEFWLTWDRMLANSCAMFPPLSKAEETDIGSEVLRAIKFIVYNSRCLVNTSFISHFGFSEPCHNPTNHIKHGNLRHSIRVS